MLSSTDYNILQESGFMTTVEVMNRTGDTATSTVVLTVSIAAVTLGAITVFFILIIVLTCLSFRWKRYNAQVQHVANNACYTTASDLQTYVCQ